MKKKVLMLFFAVLFTAFVTSAWAQVDYFQGWEDAGAGVAGWTSSGTTTFSRFTGTTVCTGTASVRSNLYTVGAITNFTSPLLGSSLGGLTTLEFNYKVANWSANNVGTPCESFTINILWATDPAGTWNNLGTIDCGNHIVAGTCAAGPGTYQFTPNAADNVYIRFITSRLAGDFYVNFDDVSVVEVPPAGYPGQPITPNPANNAIGVPIDGDLEWTFGADTDEYDLWFGPAGAMLEEVTGAAAGATGSFTYPTLDNFTTYEWQVIAHNTVAGLSTNGPVWTFTTEMGTLALPITEGFETGFVNFVNAPANVHDWTLSTTLFSEGLQSAHNAYQPSVNSALMAVGTFDLTALVAPRLYFDQIAKTENNWDHCYVEISTNAGADWIVLPASTYEGAGNYVAPTSNTPEGPCFMESSYPDWGTTDVIPENTWWKSEIFNLTDYIAFDEVLIRFRLKSDSSVQRNGWLIDNIEIKEGPGYLFSLTVPTGEDVEIEASHDYLVTIHNDGASQDDFTPTIDGVGTWTYGLYEDDGTTPLSVPMTILSGGSADFIVKVTVPGTAVPTDTDTEDFTVTSAEGAKAAQGFSITTTAIPAVPIFDITPTDNPYDFGLVYLGSSDTQQFTITNVGGGTLNISSIVKTFGSNAAFTFADNPAPIALGAGESDTFTIQFSPTADGVVTATIQVKDGTTNLYEFVVNGEGLDTTVTLPHTEDFTGVTVGGLATGWSRSHANWSAQSTANAGGTAPEMRLYWSPQVVGDMMLQTPPLDPVVTGNEWTVSFKHMLDYYGTPYTIKLQSSPDGVTWTDEWSIVDPAANVGPETITVDLGVKDAPFYLAWVGSGDSYNIDNWYIDDLEIYETPSVFWDLTMLTPVGPGTVNPAVGVHNYGGGTNINLTALPALSFFDEWQVDGAFYSAARVAPLTMDANYQAQAFFSLPAGALAQNFNAGNPVPGEWTETATETAWEYQDDSFFVNMFGGFTTIGLDINVGEEMLITPELTLDGSITEFAYWLTGGNNMVGYGGSTVQLKYQEVGAKVWTNIGAAIDMSTNESLQYVLVDISAIPNGDYNFAFAVSSTFDYAGYTSWVGIDNVVGPVLASVQSNDLEVTSVSYQNDIIYEGDTAVLSAEITNVGLNPQTGTQVTFTVDDGRTVLTTNIGTLNYAETEIVTVNYTTVGGRHTITAEVTADDNAANNSASTEGVVAVVGNLAEGFEGTVDGWSADADWLLWNAEWLPPYEGALSIAAGNTAGFAEAYLITPMVTIGAADELNFYASYGNQSTGPADLDIVYSTDGVAWTDIVTGIIPNDFMELYTIDLSGITPGDYYLGFRASATGDGTYSTWINVDHVIGPELVPQTIDVPANFAIAMVGGIPQLSWDAVTGALSYNIYGGADPYGVFAPVGVTDQLTYDLTGAEAKQFYYVTASTDAPPVMAAKRHIVVSKDAATRSVSMIQQGSGLEYKVSATKTTKDLRAPKGLK